MIMMEEKQSAGVHRVLLENRKKAVITGVQEIHSFNENEVLLLSEAGKILLKGEQLHVRKLNLEKGDAEVEGRVDSLSYLTRNAHKKDESILKRMFR
ncbi:sporulation protein YabP [Ruminococcus sp. AF17-22AC]|jgi:sporulation protein YabP|uniref:sporulation protein YabP n=1 Tax=Clostridia TaxID=186801 RepID=UPI0009FA48F5|nr:MULTISPECIES: sporulation protein YabP [Clostridia]MCB6546850.1 sporulation protein YabP [Blautia glucerasea]RGU31782.1 sporulation protein YabP [Ruminococcus sp. AF17-22AC]RHO79100.1 sporulation protein YabP [Ruminococcus sp. AF45-4BH]